MNYDVDYFIDKFSKIPEDNWCIEYYSKDGKNCALGHCRPEYSRFSNDSKEHDAIMFLFEWHPVTIIQESRTNCYIIGKPFKNPVAAINNGHTKEYQQPTPKQRILAALYDVKKLQEQSNRTDITKQLAVLPVDEKLDVVSELVTFKN